MPDLTVAENVYLGKQPTDGPASSTGAPWSPAPASISPSLGIDVDPRARMGIAADRPAAAGRARPRAVLGRPHRHPRRADLGAVAARGAAPVRGAARLRASGRSIVFISHFLDDVLAISDTVTIFRNGRRIATRSRRPDRQGLADRAHDRRRPRGARGELYRRDRARQPAGRAGRARRARARRRAAPLPTSRSTCRAGEVLGIYGFMGCGQIELARTLFGKLAADRGRH